MKKFLISIVFILVCVCCFAFAVDGIVKKSRVEKHAKECGYEICRRSGA